MRQLTILRGSTNNRVRPCQTDTLRCVGPTCAEKSAWRCFRSSVTAVQRKSGADGHLHGEYRLPSRWDYGTVPPAPNVSAGGPAIDLAPCATALKAPPLVLLALVPPQPHLATQLHLDFNSRRFSLRGQQHLVSRRRKSHSSLSANFLISTLHQLHQTHILDAVGNGPPDWPSIHIHRPWCCCHYPSSLAQSHGHQHVSRKHRGRALPGSVPR